MRVEKLHLDRAIMASSEPELKHVLSSLLKMSARIPNSYINQPAPSGFLTDTISGMYPISGLSTGHLISGFTRYRVLHTRYRDILGALISVFLYIGSDNIGSDPISGPMKKIPDIWTNIRIYGYRDTCPDIGHVKNPDAAPVPAARNLW